ncbi:hypothetical protein LSB85_003685 [Salmonella enterica]|nr:hypothetical protein [Salmonella enterica]
MIDKKLTAILDRKKAILHADIKKKMERVTELHETEGFSTGWVNAKTILDDAQAYEFAYLRDKRLRRNPTSPADSGYWIDWPHHESELTPSAIMKALEGVPEDKLRKIIADFIVFNRGLIDSAIDLTEAYQKKNGKIKVNADGKEVQASELQDYFKYVPDINSEYHPTSKRRGLSESFNQILIFNETSLANSVSKRQKSGETTQPKVGNAGKEEIRSEFRKNPGKNNQEFYDRLADSGWNLPEKRTVDRYLVDLRKLRQR